MRALIKYLEKGEKKEATKLIQKILKELNN